MDKKINFKDSFWPSFVLTILAGAVILAVVFSFMSRSVTSQELDDVFYSALDNQLKTEYGYRYKDLKDSSEFQSQTTLIRADQNGAISRQVVVYEQNIPGEETKVVTEGVGTKDTDYIKYVIAEGQGAEQLQPFVGKWAISESAPGQPAQLLARAIFDSPIMTGKLDNATRNNIMDSIKGDGNKNTNPVYIASSSEVRENGKKLYKYQTEFNYQSYIPLYQEYLRAINLPNLADELTAPEGDAKNVVTIFVDPATKSIVKVERELSEVSVTEYYNFNRFIAVPAVPDKVDMTYMEMQQALSQ